MYTVNDVVSLVNKYISSHSRYQFLYGTFEDMRSEMLLEVYKKINKYDENRSKLSTFIYIVCYTKIRRDLQYTNRKERWETQVISLDTPIRSDSEILQLRDVIPDENNFEDNIQNKEILKKISVGISKETYEYYILGIPMVDIAKETGVTKQEISRRIKANVRRLANIYNGDIQVRKGTTMEQVHEIMEKYGCCRRTAFRKLAKMRKENENNNK